MEGITWLRLGTIAALFLGSVYVLLPTAFQGDLEAQRAAAASAVESPDKKTRKANLTVRLETDDPTALVPVLQTRLDAAGLRVERVQEKEGVVVVTLRPGTHREEVLKACTEVGQAKIYPAKSVASVPALLPAVPDPKPSTPIWSSLQIADPSNLGWWGQKVGEWPNKPVPPGIEALDLTVTGLEGKTLSLSSPLPEAVAFGVVAIDAKMVGLAFRDGDSSRFEPLGSNKAVAGFLTSGSLPGPVREVVDKEVLQQSAEIVITEPMLPPWALALLPDTVMQLGLDLQGGLDLTLQVELDDAVLAQVARDSSSARDLAETNKVEITGMRRERSEPVVWFEAPGGFDELAEFIRTNMTGYVVNASDGDWHSFRMNDTRIDEVQKSAVEQVLETLRKRVDATGVKEPSIVKKPGGRINVQLPGAVDLQQAIDAIGTTALLEFRMVVPGTADRQVNGLVEQAEQAMPADQFLDDRIVNQWLWENDFLEQDRMILWHYNETADGMERVTYTKGSGQERAEGPLLLVNEVVLTGNDVADAGTSLDGTTGFPNVTLAFKPRGSQIFCDVTTKHTKERFAIILDNQIRSAPSIKQRICGGRASIEMGNSMDALQDANTLALVLRTGSLDAPVSIGEVRQVGASLGRDAIRSGSIASVAGGAIVLFFMALWYRRAGMVANVALALNIVMVLAALALFGATLTLPGIAGIALTVGMAVDANIIIFERIREELALGVHPRKAVDTGFEKGFVAVVDANVTTAIAGVVLYSYGTGPIKGFAVTLLIGIVTTLITALFVTRTFMELMTRSSNARITI